MERGARARTVNGNSYRRRARRFFLDIVVAERAPVLELFSSEDQTLLVRRNSFFILDLLLDVLDGVARLDVKGDGFSSESFNKDLHLSKCTIKLKYSTYGHDTEAIK